jgi:uncharacterized membrane protein YagU involved in acid resistance
MKPTMHPTIARMLTGAAAGTLATIPMSAVMLAWHRRLPRTKRDPVPPAQIVNELAKSLGIHHQTTHDQRLRAAVVAHFGYGSAMGALYGLTADPKSASTALPTGIAFGLGVWAGSYLGLLPAAGLYRSATEEPAERNQMMIAAHIAWGASLGLLVHGLRKAATSGRGASRSSNPPLRRYRRRIRRALASVRESV